MFVSNTWVTGDIMDLDIRPETNGLPRITLLGEPGKPHILQGSTDFTNWIPLITNAPVNSRFEFLDTNAASYRNRFYRGVEP